jgi:tRNA(fMet)-specific endonuclease VapC
MLDTNTVSHLFKRPQGAVAQRIAEVGKDNICVSVVVAAEMRYGSRKKNSVRLSAAVEEYLARVEVVPFGPPADEAYADIRLSLEGRGTPISPNDMLIAAHAISLGMTLVTDNMREFTRIEGLTMENWVQSDELTP